VDFLRIIMLSMRSFLPFSSTPFSGIAKAAGFSTGSPLTGPAPEWQWALAIFPFLLLIYIDYP